MEALENREDLLGIVRLNANAIIRHREQVPAVALAGRNMDARRLAAAIFDGVADQVLEYLGKPAFVNRDHGQSLKRHRRARLFNTAAQRFQRSGEHRGRIDPRWRSFRILRGSGVGKKVLDQSGHAIRRGDDGSEKAGDLAARFLAETAFQELGAECNRAEGLLQVMAGGIREGLQVLVDVLQVFIGTFQLRLRPLRLLQEPRVVHRDPGLRSDAEEDRFVALGEPSRLRMSEEEPTQPRRFAR